MIYTLHKNAPTFPAERVAYEGIEYARKNAIRLIERGRTKVVYILDSNKVLTGKVFKGEKTLFYRDYKKAIVREIRKNGSTVPYR